uniref:DNA-damage-inducible protein d n=1 Tax=uncultured bacterium contig00019 TaxID=1181510 RepID=A0A806KE59_9BACT|nr:DNA-damage-inducible protein d [uncultured bacterium contig00019]
MIKSNMAQSTSIKLFQDKNIRTVWDEEREKWYFSVHDVIAILTDQPDYQKVRNYWKWLRNKLKQEGSQLGSNTTQLKMVAPDGKMRETDAADSEQILRLIQSVPSKNAEGLKLIVKKKL